jgi:diguanylate cyclase (GGDEF)-like protein/PAS domain S-box-containing protein
MSANAANDLGRNGGPQIVVVIDDSQSMLEVMLQLLEPLENCQAKGFTDPAEGLGYCLNNQVDLLITDYEMPKLNGMNVVEGFRREKSKSAVPVVMVTSTKDKDIRYMALQMGATDFVTKPVDQLEFVPRIRNLLAASRAYRVISELSEWLTDEVRKVTMVMAQLPVSVIFTDRSGTVDYVNPQYLSTTGFTADEVVGHTAPILSRPDMPAQLYAEILESINIGIPWMGNLQGLRKDGSTYWQRVTILPVRDKQGQITNFAVVSSDLTQQKEWEAKLNRQSNFDALTGLPNRMLARDRLDQAIAHAARNDSKVAVIFFDLDRFRMVNETQGHNAADELLRMVAERIKLDSRPDATFARMGNDEFLLILPKGDEAESEAERICRALALPFKVGGNQLFVSASVGVALYPTDGDNSADLLSDAQAAAEAVKAKGGNAWRFFTSELDADARNRLNIENHLRHALANGEFTLHYQPLIHIESGRIMCAEALLRWNSVELGAVRPDHFIPIAEETGLIVPIGAWVAGQVCRDMAGWTEAGLPCPRIAFNVSSRQFADRTLVEAIRAGMQANGIHGDQLEVEVTERLVLDRTPATLQLLEEMQDLGIRFSVDDFGTGYSSMSYLTAYPFDVLKVDRSFVSKVTESKQDAALTQAIVAMARAIDLEVVAEGVETEEQLEFLRQVGCTFAQGYLFARPAPNEAFATMLQSAASHLVT